MARPRKNTGQKKNQGTYRKDRDPALKAGAGLDTEMVDIVKAKLEEAKTIIKDTSFKDKAKELLQYANCYKALVNILSLYIPENKQEEKSIVDSSWKD
jgi:hypothetical protein